MLAIDRLKRILSGTKRLSTIDGRDAPEALEPPMASIRWSGERSSPPPPAPPQYNELPPYLKPRRSSSGDSLSTNSSSGEMKSLNQPLESEYANTSNMHPKPPAVVPIKVKRSMSQSTPNSVGDGKDCVTHQKMCQSFHAPPDRTSDYSDRENTPTGDDSYKMSNSPMEGVAPVAPLVAAKPKPVAMIVAKSKQSSREGSPDIIDIEKHEAEKNNDGYKSPVKNLEGFKFPLASNGSLKRRTSEHIYDTPQIGPPRTVNNYVNYPPLSMNQVPTGPASPLHVSTQFAYSHQQSGSPRSSQQNSPGGRVKKAPPPPPKRNASLRHSEIINKNSTSNSGQNVTRSGPGMTSVLSPPPIQQKPQISTPQSQAFVNCVQSLSERFGKKSEENSAGDNLSSDNEDLPPAPPVAMEIIEPKISNYGLLGKSDKTSSGEYMLQQRLKRESSSSASPTSNGVESAFGVKLRQAKTESQSQNQSSDNSVIVNPSCSVVSQSSVQDKNGVNTQNAQNCVQQNSDSANVTKDSKSQVNESEKLKKTLTGSGRGDLSSSTSSLDSNTLPFANENVGTIKQRAQQSKPSLVMILDDGNIASHGEENLDHTDAFTDNTDTIKRTPNKLPKPLQQTVQKLQQPKLLPKPQLQPSGQLQQQASGKQQVQGTQSQKLEQDRLVQQQKLSQTAQPMAQPQYNASVTASFVPGAQSLSQSSGNGEYSKLNLLRCSYTVKPYHKQVS